LISFTKYKLALISGVVALMALSYSAGAQVVGGQFAFEFLRMANSAHVSALGGMTVANPDNDISFALQNPAMMRPGLHNQLELTYNSYYADIKVMDLQYGWHAPSINTSFFFGLQYINYGNFTETNDIGNIYGTGHAVDYAVAFGASRKYLEHWRYGADVKLAYSNYAGIIASAVMTDVGVNYYDTSSLWDFGLTAKNMGVMAAKYTSNIPSEPLPFDLQLGVSKRFKHMPLRLFATMHHLYEWDVRYANPDDLTSTSNLGKLDTASDKGSHFGDKLFRHFIFGAELTLGKRIVLTGSYNDLQRRELVLTTAPGLAGFAFGVGLYLNKFQVHYGRTYFHVAGPYNELSLTMCLNKLFGLGKTGDRIKWTTEYPDWE